VAIIGPITQYDVSASLNPVESPWFRTVGIYETDLASLLLAIPTKGHLLTVWREDCLLYEVFPIRGATFVRQAPDLSGFEVTNG
jgi:hypothetical protein